MAVTAVSSAETLTTTLVLKVPFSGGQNSIGTPKKLRGLKGGKGKRAGDKRGEELWLT